MKANFTRIGGHVRCTRIWRKTERIHIKEKDQSNRVTEIESERKIHKQTELLIVCHAVTQTLVWASASVVSVIGPHLPPAVCHSKGDGHGRPFAPTGWRLLVVPENYDLE